ncbi:phenylalanine--tRNA ligase subunit beta [Dokdonella sp.]|uniref:phenylalanine--tRNA ligase subunit beta n=1 Tax=Dokdonella sp. TaxID=2291710 RepID=UPI001B12AD43|nr:phenylalanine--tRNA ligase subunit beta [Dokdonella sp.]MBO9663675.1 phenylalanine--tRNA ligase subunit beta [Dokdonella sp.]
MKISENWLRERVPLQADRATLAERFDMIGHEVESIESLGAQLDGVVVAQIASCAKHPEADRLQVCEVDAGGEKLQIVCGAPNARAGLKAPLAKVGAQVGTLSIKAAKLRGVESFGMLCSAKELGLDADASGLLELPADAPVGTPLAQYFGLPDAVFDLGLTPNRADCLSLEGLAKDVAAAFDVPFAPLAIEAVPAQSERRIEIRLDAPADCPRYCGRYISGIDAAAPTPPWMRERLRRSGLRPISLLVDVTNYVMLELGQPLHAFDADTLQGPIGVRRARAGETLRLLDERDVTLDGHFLLITDADRPVALAGLMGGWDTRIGTTTKNLFLEAAHFAPAALAGRARKLGMHTDAAHRFERGVDPELPRRALERATRLIVEAAGGEVGPILEAVSSAHLPVRAPVRLRRARIARVLGIEVPDAAVERILGALGMQVEADADGWIATPPSARFDIAIEEDLIEEVARIHGYERIPDRAPSGELVGPALREDRVGLAALREQLAARGYLEAITYAFVAREQLETWTLADGAIALANPLSAELSVMRTSLLPGLVAALATNRSRQQTRVRLFEAGRAYFAGDDAPREVARIAGVACGRAVAEQWGEAARALDFFDAKGDVESLFALASAASEFDVVPATQPWLHPGQSAEIRRGGRHVGYVGALHPNLTRALDLGEDVYAFELDLDVLVERGVPVAQPLSRFPSVRRDLSFELPEEVPYAQVEEAIRGAVGETLTDIVLFDRYAGPNLGSDVKSLAIGLILQDRYRTLTDPDADRCVALAVAALESGCKAKLRG